MSKEIFAEKIDNILGKRRLKPIAIPVIPAPAWALLWAERISRAAFLLLSAAGWMRMFDSLGRWYWLEFSGVWPGPLYLAVTGALWGAAGLVSLIWLIRRLPWNRLVALGAAFLFIITYWADRLLFTRAPYAGSNTGFAVLVTALCIYFALGLLSPYAEIRRLFKRGQEPGSQY